MKLLTQWTAFLDISYIWGSGHDSVTAKNGRCQEETEMKRGCMTKVQPHSG